MRQRFAMGLGGSLRVRPPEPGVASAARVTLRRSSGTELPVPVVDQPAQVAQDGVLSYELVPANTPDPRAGGYLYRAVWVYTVAGVEYFTDQVYEVNARLLKPMLRPTDLSPLLPAAWPELIDGGETAAAVVIAEAWSDLLDDLGARDIRPDLIMDTDRLHRPHRSKAFAMLFEAFGPQWAEEATRREQVYQTDLAQLLSAPGWYDKDQSGTGSDAETRIGTLVLTR